MKKFHPLLSSISCLLIFIQISHVTQVLANDTQGSIVLSTEFKTDNASLLSLKNNYGSIIIKNHDKAVIEVSVSINIPGVSATEYDEIIRDIEIQSSQTSGTILIESILSGKADKYIRQLNGFNSNDFDIRFSILMPSDFPCSIQHKYGQVSIEELTQLQFLRLQYGKLDAGYLNSPKRNPLANIDLAYSKGKISTCKWMKLNLKYSHFEISNSEALIVVSQYSKIYIDKGSSLVSESRYDTYRLGELSNFVTNAKYSNVHINVLSHKCILETAYTDVKVKLLKSEFTAVNVHNSYGTIQIGIDPDANYQLIGDAKYAKIIAPFGQLINRVTDNNQTHIEATIGTGKSSGKVTIDTKYGAVKLVP